MTPAEVKSLRLTLNWTQARMAHYLSADRSSVSSWETRRPPRGPVLKLLHALAAEVRRGKRVPQRRGRGPHKSAPDRAAAE
jgi:DNA-binding transcriptional regulator YiaG